MERTIITTLGYLYNKNTIKKTVAKNVMLIVINLKLKSLFAFYSSSNKGSYFMSWNFKDHLSNGKLSILYNKKRNNYVLFN